MISNGPTLLLERPILHMKDKKMVAEGTTYGLGEAGYDIRIKQDVEFRVGRHWLFWRTCSVEVGDFVMKGLGDQFTSLTPGRFALASAMEEFAMPNDLMGVVHDKSTWARRGLSVFNTVIEPGWAGFLTLELVYHGDGVLRIPSGSGIAQVVFNRVTNPAQYDGRYQNQANEPVPAKDA